MWVAPGPNFRPSGSRVPKSPGDEITSLHHFSPPTSFYHTSRLVFNVIIERDLNFRAPRTRDIEDTVKLIYITICIKKTPFLFTEI